MSHSCSEALLRSGRTKRGNKKQNEPHDLIVSLCLNTVSVCVRACGVVWPVLIMFYFTDQAR